MTEAERCALNLFHFGELPLEVKQLVFEHVPANEKAVIYSAVQCKSSHCRRTVHAKLRVTG